jgi:hypothetical protein
MRLQDFCLDRILLALEIPNVFPIPAFAQTGVFVAVDREIGGRLGFDEVAHELRHGEPGRAVIEFGHFEEGSVALNDFGKLVCADEMRARGGGEGR